MYFTAEPSSTTGGGRTCTSVSQNLTQEKRMSDWDLSVSVQVSPQLPVAPAPTMPHVPPCPTVPCVPPCLFLGFCFCFAGAPP